jgi:hypothetical protein
MNATKINIIIATQRGFTGIHFELTVGPGSRLERLRGYINGVPRWVPDYAGSLDEIANLIRDDYSYTARGRLALSDNLHAQQYRYDRNMYFFNLTALDWCEAYLRTKGLWQE